MNFPIWFADSLEFEFSSRLKALNALAGDDRCSGVAVRRSPINLGLSIGVPDCEYHDMALAIVVNAKTQRPSVCNAAEKLLVHERIAAEYVPRIVKKLIDAGVEVRGTGYSRPERDGRRVVDDPGRDAQAPGLRRGLLVHRGGRR